MKRTISRHCAALLLGHSAQSIHRLINDGTKTTTYPRRDCQISMKRLAQSTSTNRDFLTACLHGEDRIVRVEALRRFIHTGAIGRVGRTRIYSLNAFKRLVLSWERMPVGESVR